MATCSKTIKINEWTKIFNFKNSGGFILNIKDVANNKYGTVFLMETSESGLENTDFRGFLSFPRKLPCNFSFTFDKEYSIKKETDGYLYIQISSTSLDLNDSSMTFDYGTIGPSDSLKRIYVGPNGNFTTLNEAVISYNNGNSNTQILLDAGDHFINETIVIDNSNYKLNIIGLGFNLTTLKASTGLTGKPMFEIRSDLTIFERLTADGSSLSGYGTQPNENFVNFTSNNGVYCEFNDFYIKNFYIAFNDIIGVSYYMQNFTIENCVVGNCVNYPTNTTEQQIDFEVGNYDNCNTGIQLLQTGTGKQSFIFINLIFNNNSNSVAIEYNGNNYKYGMIANIYSCSWNNIGKWNNNEQSLNGFDFTNPRDSDIEVNNNTFTEDKKPHAKINLTDNTGYTTITTNGIYYVVNVANTIQYACKFTLGNCQLTYNSHHLLDMSAFLSGSLSVNQNNRTITIGIRRDINIKGLVSVIGNGSIITVATTNDHCLLTGQKVQFLGLPGTTPGIWNGVYTITVINSKQFRYSNTGSGTASLTGVSVGAILGGTSVRTAASNFPYNFSTNVYLNEMNYNDLLQIYVTSISNGDAVTVSDLDLLVKP